MAVQNTDREASAPDADLRRGLADPPPVTPFAIVYEGELLRLRRYGAATEPSGTPVVLVYSLFKRPYVLDLVPDRSVVQSLLRQGFCVYLTDWLPPAAEHVERGLYDYVERELATALEHVRRIERVERAALVGFCLGSFLAAVYAALHPQNVERLVVLALPFDSRPPFVTTVVEYMTRFYGNVPAWWIRAGLNARVADRRDLPDFLAAELGEPARSFMDGDEPARHAIEDWLASDVPFAGRLFRDVMGDAYGRGEFSAQRLVVGTRRVALDDIRCPVLNVCAARDRLVPASESAAFSRCVGNREAASNLVFDCGHLGLILGRAAHESLWPHVAAWLAGEKRFPPRAVEESSARGEPDRAAAS